MLALATQGRAHGNSLIRSVALVRDSEPYLNDPTYADHETQAAHHLLFGYLKPPGQEPAHPLGRDSAKRGWELFNTKARCNLCHALTDNQRDVTLFTDNDFHNIGVGILRHHVGPLAQRAERELAQGNLPAVDTAAIASELSVLGRFLVTRKQEDIASFKTPGLRNVLVTGPYFHDGSMETLWDVMDHYNKGDGISDPWLDEDMQPLALTESEIDDVVAFLASLTSPQYKEAGDQEYARQLALSKVNRPQRDTQRAFGPKPKQPPPPTL